MEEFALGVNGTKNSEEFRFVEDEYDPDTGEMTIELEFSPPADATGYDDGCRVESEAVLRYEFEFKTLPEQIESTSRETENGSWPPRGHSNARD